jgi:hypothetical protein
MTREVPDLTAKERAEIAALLRRGLEVEAIKLVRDYGGRDRDGGLRWSLQEAIACVGSVRRELTTAGEKLPSSMARLIRARSIDGPRR